MPVRLHTIPAELVAEDPVSDPIRVHREMWSEAIIEASREGASVLLMPPDVVWSDGSLRHVAKLLAQGRKVIFNFFLRVVSDTFIRGFLDHHPALDGVIAVPARELVDFSMRHIHPLMGAYSRSWQYFPDHTEMIIWPVRGEGILVRTLARECLLFDPEAYPLNDRNLINDASRPHEIEFIDDSDDLFAVSLTPLGKELDRWLSAPKQLEVSWLGRWWLEYDSPANDLTATAKVRIHHGDRTRRTWQQVALASDLFMRRTGKYREAWRAWRAVHNLECDRAAELVALAIETGEIFHVTPPPGRLVILAPSDAGMKLLPEAQLVGMLQRTDRRGVNSLIRAHVAVLDDEAPDLELQLERERRVELTALDGNKIRLRAERYLDGSDAVIVVNNLYVVSRRLRSGRNIALRFEGLLDSDIAEVSRSSSRRAV